jgi:hypothetical protein
LACDASDVLYIRHRVVRALVEHNADLEARTEKRATPYLLAAGAAVGTTMAVLLELGADRRVVISKERPSGGMQRAIQASSSCVRILRGHGVPKNPKMWAKWSNRQRAVDSVNRQVRRSMNQMNLYCSDWRPRDQGT